MVGKKYEPLIPKDLRAVTKKRYQDVIIIYIFLFLKINI